MTGEQITARREPLEHHIRRWGAPEGAKRGLWRGTFVAPWAWRKRKRSR